MKLRRFCALILRAVSCAVLLYHTFRQAIGCSNGLFRAVGVAVHDG
jgi:hypothetical protein